MFGLLLQLNQRLQRRESGKDGRSRAGRGFQSVTRGDARRGAPESGTAGEAGCRVGRSANSLSSPAGASAGATVSPPRWMRCGDADAHLAAVHAQHRQDDLVTDHELFTDASCEDQWGRPVRMSGWDDRGGVGGKGITYLYPLRPEMGWAGQLASENHRESAIRTASGAGRPELEGGRWGDAVGRQCERLKSAKSGSRRPYRNDSKRSFDNRGIL
ncbi:MAG: hypothetical protein JWO04_2294 [Gammaproteobacteria bacterium]|nr:hypothetical protein [Gammaproteobacteria bacterium]